MFTYNTTDQLIIGLKSLHPIFRMIKEKHFKSISILYPQDDFHFVPKTVKKIEHFTKRQHIKTNIYQVDVRHDALEIDKTTDLIISCGRRHVHDIAKISNKSSANLYCIESIAGRLPSYGTGVIWTKKSVIKEKIIPNIIFNSCRDIHRWNIEDLIYFIHDISLALDAVLLPDTNDFIIASAMNGIINFFNLYKQIKQTRNKRKLRKLFVRLAYADVLMKNAYNNMPLSRESLHTASVIDHYRQFEVAITYESNDVIQTHAHLHGERLSELLSYHKWDLDRLMNAFNDIYSEFSKHPQKDEIANDILGKKYFTIFGKNMETRRVL